LTSLHYYLTDGTTADPVLEAQRSKRLSCGKEHVYKVYNTSWPDFTEMAN